MTAAAGDVPGRSPPAAPPAATRPTDESCSQWIGGELRYCCAVETTRYALGYRCGQHDLRLQLGLPALPPSPGIPAYRQEATPS